MAWAVRLDQRMGRAACPRHRRRCVRKTGGLDARVLLGSVAAGGLAAGGLSGGRGRERAPIAESVVVRVRLQIGGAGMPLAMGAQQSSGGAPDMSMSGFPSASPPVGGAVGDPTPRHRSGLWGAAPSMTKADLPQQGAGEIDETHEVDMDMGDQPMEL